MVSIKKIPTLRFPEFSGEWEEKKLGEIAKIVGGGTPSTEVSEYWNGNIQWFTPTEVGSKKYINNSVRTISDLGLSKSSAKILPKGTILLTTRATLGEMSISTKVVSTNQGFQSIIVNKENVTEFIYYLQPKIKKYCYINAVGSTFLEVSKKMIEKCVIAIPSLSEQQKIANCLTAMDDMIDAQQQKVEQFQAYKKGLLQQIFSQTLRFPGYEGAWEAKKLGEVMIEYSDKNNSALNKVVAVGKYGIRLREEIYNKELSKDISKNKVIGKNTLTIGMGTKQIDIGILHEDKVYSVSPAYSTFKLMDVNSVFFEAYLQIENRYLSALYMVTGAREGKNIDKEGFLKHKLFFPSFPEQQKIADCLSTLDDVIELETQKLEQLRQYKKGLLQQLFV